MSADNYIGVIRSEDGKYGLIPYGNMSQLGEDCMYRGRVEGSYFDDRASALVAAHDLYKTSHIVEYGVIELDPLPDEPCGKCYVCINERKVVHNDTPLCDGCNQPISTSEWMTLSNGKTYHNRCEPGRG